MTNHSSNPLRYVINAVATINKQNAIKFKTRNIFSSKKSEAIDIKEKDNTTIKKVEI